MSTPETFPSLRVTRRTGETSFSITLSPRRQVGGRVALPNQLLGHLLDHFLKGCGIAMAVEHAAWPGSWRFDHVLCEDIGQLVGSGVAAIHQRRVAQQGVAGRACVSACMDESLVECTISFEGRPRSDWRLADGIDIDGFVDAWYDEKGNLCGWTTGTNLRQFLDGFAIGTGCTMAMTVHRGGNLHHVFEAAFRALGDAVGAALGTQTAASRVAGESSGFAGAAEYTAEEIRDA